MKTMLRYVFSVFTALAMMTAFLPSPATAGFNELVDLIGAPSDGGTGPVIWYQTAREPNHGNGASTLTLTSGNGSMTVQRPDFFGNPTGAFALAGGTPGGAAVTGGAATTYLTGDEATLVMTFQTPPAITANTSLFNRGSSATGAGNPKFELFLLANGNLRLATGDTTFGILNVLGALTPDTWYYVAVTWDLKLPGNRIAWYLGEMGSITLNSGFVADTVNVVGGPLDPIYVSGRASFDTFTGSFQNIAIYDRHLSAQAIQDQFAEAALPLPQIGVFHPDEPIEGIFQDYAFGVVFLQDALSDTESRTVRFVNMAEEEVVVQDIFLEGDAGGAFSVGLAPETPFALPVGETFDVEVVIGGEVTGGRTLLGELILETNLASAPPGTPVNSLTQYISAVAWTTGDPYLLNVNPGLDFNTAGWTQGGVLEAPGFGGSGQKVRLVGNQSGPSMDSFGQVITGGAGDFDLKFLFAIPAFPTADANFGDRSFQLIIHSGTGIPASGAWRDSHAGSAMINLAYFPAGVGGGGEGFYVFDGNNWQFISQLGTLEKSDDQNVYQLTVSGYAFGTPAASYDIAISEVNSTTVAATATGLTASHSTSITANKPRAFVFTTGDYSTSSGNGPLDPAWTSSFWVDEVFFALRAELPAAVMTLAVPPARIRVGEGGRGTSAFALRNDGLGGMDLNVSEIEFADGFSLVSPELPVSMAEGETETFTVSFDSAGRTGESAVVGGTIISNNAFGPLALPLEGLVYAPGNFLFGTFEVPGSDPVNNTDTFAGWDESVGANPQLTRAVPGLVAGSETAAFLRGSRTSSEPADSGVLVTTPIRPLANFKLELYFAVKESVGGADTLFRVDLRGILLLYRGDGVWLAHNGTAFVPIMEGALTPSVDADGNGSLDDPGDTKVVYRLVLDGRDLGTAGRTFDLAIYDASDTLVVSGVDLPTRNTNLFDRVEITSRWGNSPGFWVDEIVAISTEPMAEELRITSFGFDPNVSPNTTLRWTDIGADYEIVATGELPFGGSDTVIPVSPEHGSIDRTTFPQEIEFSFQDPAAAEADRRFWRVRIVQP